MNSVFPPHLVDFYKPGHAPMYPAGTELVYSNLTARSDKLAKALPDFDHKVVWFGLQGFVQEVLIDLWNDSFFDQPKADVVRRFQRRMDSSLGVGAISPKHFEDLHDLGYLPIRIKALPEGSRVDMRVPLLTIVNTKPEFFWLTNYLETLLSAELWKTFTSATTAYEFRRLFDQYAKETGTDPAFVAFQGHDFSMRGMSGYQDAMKSGAAHLLSFSGTDTVCAIDYVEAFYGAKGFIGGSVPASEHSVMCMGGLEDETETFKRLITEVYPKGIVSIVSDTWDFWSVMTKTVEELKPLILSREGKVVFRPDSGDPVKILVGSVEIKDLSDDADTLDEAKDYAEELLVDDVGENTPHGEHGDSEATGYFSFQGVIYKAVVEIEWNRHDKQYYFIDGRKLKSFEITTLTPEQKGAVQCLWEVFGGTTNENGFRTLDLHVGLIYGDSITLYRAQRILARLKAMGFSSANVVFGIGSYTYQYVTRDTFGSAVKATFGVVNDEDRELFKDPKTDTGLKKSARGLLRVEKEGDKFVLYDQQTWEQEAQGELQTVFEDGFLHNYQTLNEIRNVLHKCEAHK